MSHTRKKMSVKHDMRHKTSTNKYKYNTPDISCLPSHGRFLFIDQSLFQNDVVPADRRLHYLDTRHTAESPFHLLYVSDQPDQSDASMNYFEVRYDLWTNNIFVRMRMPGPTPIPLLGEMVNFFRKVSTLSSPSTCSPQLLPGSICKRRGSCSKVRQSHRVREQRYVEAR